LLCTRICATLGCNCHTAIWTTSPKFYRKAIVYPSPVSPGVKDVFVWLTETPAPSDFFVVCYRNVLVYLLTFLWWSLYVQHLFTDDGAALLLFAILCIRSCRSAVGQCYLLFWSSFTNIRLVWNIL